MGISFFLAGIIILLGPIVIFILMLNMSSKISKLEDLLWLMPKIMGIEAVLRGITDKLELIEKRLSELATDEKAASMAPGAETEELSARTSPMTTLNLAQRIYGITEQDPSTSAMTTPVVEFMETTEPLQTIEAPETVEPEKISEPTPEVPPITTEAESREAFRGESPPQEEPHWWAPSQSPEPKPSWLDIHIQNARAWLFSEGNIWVTIGVLLCIAGFGLLFSYAAQMKWISFETRLILSGAVGAAMTAFGWRMRERRRTYALILQGGGAGIMYVVLVAGAKLGPIAPAVAIPGMIALSLFTAFLAVRQDFEPLAIFALLGGFSAPVIVSTGSSDFVALFSIYSLLNLEILIINVRRDWLKVRWGGMAVSAVAGAVWGFFRWRPILLATVEPFLALYFVNYAATAMLPMLRGKAANFIKSERVKPDIAMTATLPFIFLALQMKAAEHTAWGVSIACAALGAFYLGLFFYARRGDDHSSRKLSGMFLAFGVIFLNLAVPFAFRKAAASCLWAAEGALLIAFSAKLGRRARLSGIILQICAFLIYLLGPLIQFSSKLYDPMFRLNGFLDWRNADSNFLLTSLIFAASAFVSSWFSERKHSEKQPLPEKFKIEWLFSIYGAVWWTLAATHAASFVIRTPDVTVMLLLCAGACAAYFAHHRMGWESSVAVAFPPVAVMTVFAMWSIFPRLESPYGSDETLKLFSLLWTSIRRNNLLNWFAAAAMFIAALQSYRNKIANRLRSLEWGLILFAVTSYSSYIWKTWVFNMINDPTGTSQSDLHHLVFFLPIMASAIIFASEWGADKIGMKDYRTAGLEASWALMATALVPFATGLVRTGSGIRGYYIPFINPLELWQILYIAAAWILFISLRAPSARRAGFVFVLPAVVFLWLNCVAARAAFHYFGESVRWGTLGSSPHFQAIIAILWGTAALALIYCGKRFEERYPWFLGAGLLALDIAKLIFFDLRNSATIIRIVAFLATGAFFLFVGWTAPLPPKKTR